MTTKIDLNEPIRNQAINLLGPLQAAMTDLMLASKEAHWNVKGPNFIALHELFDQTNTLLSAWVDDLAERSVELGGRGHGVLSAVAKASPLKAYPEALARGEDHLKALSAHLAAAGSLVRTGIDSAAGFGDADTADLLTEISRGLDKQLWFLEAHLG